METSEVVTYSSDSMRTADQIVFAFEESLYERATAICQQAGRSEVSSGDMQQALSICRESAAPASVPRARWDELHAWLEDRKRAHVQNVGSEYSRGAHAVVTEAIIFACSLVPPEPKAQKPAKTPLLLVRVKNFKPSCEWQWCFRENGEWSSTSLALTCCRDDIEEVDEAASDAEAVALWKGGAPVRAYKAHAPAKARGAFR